MPGFKNAPNHCVIAGCSAAFDPDGDQGAGWVFRDGYGWHCPEHAALASKAGA